MKGKMIRLVVLATCILGAPILRAKDQSVWDSSPVGHCFKSPEKFLQDFYGENSQNDDQLKVTPVDLVSGGQVSKEFFWIYDSTVDINQTQTFFRRKNDGQWCALLYVPLSTPVDVMSPHNGQLPLTFTSQEVAVSGWVVVIVQKLNASSGTYEPLKCYKKLLGTDKQKPLNCHDVFK